MEIIKKGRKYRVTNEITFKKGGDFYQGRIQKVLNPNCFLVFVHSLKKVQKVNVSQIKTK